MKKLIMVMLTACFVLGFTVHGETAIKKQYYDTGELKYELNYQGGKLEGVSKEYDKSGKLIRTYTYENDVLIAAKKLTSDAKRLELGPLGFLRSWIFWLVLVIVVGVLGWLGLKMMMKDRAF